MDDCFIYEYFVLLWIEWVSSMVSQLKLYDGWRIFTVYTMSTKYLPDKTVRILYMNVNVISNQFLTHVWYLGTIWIKIKFFKMLNLSFDSNCFIHIIKSLLNHSKHSTGRTQANSVDPDQNTPRGAVLTGSTSLAFLRDKFEHVIYWLIQLVLF